MNRWIQEEHRPFRNGKRTMRQLRQPWPMINRIYLAVGGHDVIRYGIRVAGKSGDTFEETEIIGNLDVWDGYWSMDDDVIPVSEMLVR